MRPPSQELKELTEAGLLRSLSLRTGETTQGMHLHNFSSNDYLGLSQHPNLKEAAKRAVDHYGTGATASRLVCGNFPYHQELEARIANLKQTDGARLFANGYSTALGAITAIVGKGDTIILDKLAHACLIDAARLSGATLRVFPHNDLGKLEDLLRKVSEQGTSKTRTLIVTESVFSMDGDLCPLAEIVALKDQYGALLLLDEAHALGVLGPSGLGLAEKLTLQDQVDFQMGTLGKAAGSAGGYLAANQEWIDLLTNKARSLIYSTAPPPSQVAASHAALELITSSEGQTLRERLRENLAFLQVDTEEPPITPIIPLILGSNEAALTASEKLREKGFLIPAIRFPTVPRNTARLRITLSAAHSKEEVFELNQALANL